MHTFTYTCITYICTQQVEKSFYDNTYLCYKYMYSKEGERDREREGERERERERGREKEGQRPKQGKEMLANSTATRSN